VVQKDGAEMTLPFARLSPQSVNLARPLAQTLAPTVPKAGITFAGMMQDPSWLTNRVGVDQLFMESLRFFSERGQTELFAAISPFITNSSELSLAELSLRLGRPEGTLKSDISRLRAKCQQMIRDQVAATLDDPTPENITAELKELMGYRASS
jgi:hypothetical protein